MDKHGQTYLIVTDYYTKYPFVKKMEYTTSSAVAKVTSECFSMFSPPLQIITDNGPQYVGKPYHIHIYTYTYIHIFPIVIFPFPH